METQPHNNLVDWLTLAGPLASYLAKSVEVDATNPPGSFAAKNAGPLVELRFKFAARYEDGTLKLPGPLL